MQEIFDDTLGEVGNIMMGAGATNLAGLLSSAVRISSPVVEVGPPVEAWPGGKALRVEVSMIGALEGDSLFILPEADVAVIVKIMCAGMEISDDEIFGEMGLSAVGEAMNQLMAGAAIALSDVLGDLVDISPPVLTMLDGTEVVDQIPDDQTRIVFEVFIGDDFHGQLSWLMSPQLANMLVERVQEGMGGGSGQSAVETTLGDVVAEQQADAAPPIPDAAPPMPAAPPAQAEPVPMAAPPPMSEHAMQPAAIAVQPVAYPDLGAVALSSAGRADMGLLSEVMLTVTVELGNTSMLVKEVLELSEGSIVELDRPAGAPVDVFINGTLVARGDVVVVDDELGVRVSEVLDPADRTQRL